MFLKRQILILLPVLLFSSCVTEFLPQIDEEKELVVVEGLITDQVKTNTIKLSKSLPLGEKGDARPLTGCIVSISDNLGYSYTLIEKSAGKYVTDSTAFRGEVGKFYTLHIRVDNGYHYSNYESYPVEMKPVPQIDSLYYEKISIRENVNYIEGIEECQIYLDTYDPNKNCRFFRWDYSETWILRLIADVPNQTCWISNNSKNIYIESTETLKEDRLRRHPVTYISNETDRLKREYSILVNQYSLNEDEYNYWKKLQKLTEESGGLYDIIPASVPSNIMCIEDPGEKILGYFSVSAISSKRIFIKDSFEGINDPYARCASDTLLDGPEYIEGLGVTKWTIFDIKPTPFSGKPRIRIFTEIKGCADCTIRGSTLRPDYWIDLK
jgi:hypothetical protein